MLEASYGRHGRRRRRGTTSFAAGSDADTLAGGAGDDTVRGGAGDDSLDGGPDTDGCYGDEGVDTAMFCETAIGIP